MSGQGPGGHYRWIGPSGLENLNDHKENNPCEKDHFRAGLVHRKLSAIGKSLTLGLARIGNPSDGLAVGESDHSSTYLWGMQNLGVFSRAFQNGSATAIPVARVRRWA